MGRQLRCRAARFARGMGPDKVWQKFFPYFDGRCASRISSKFSPAARPRLKMRERIERARASRFCLTLRPKCFWAKRPEGRAARGRPGNVWQSRLSTYKPILRVSRTVLQFRGSARRGKKGTITWAQSSCQTLSGPLPRSDSPAH